MGRFDGQVALITGGARGMGRSHALALAREGADIAIIDVCHDLPSILYPLASAADLSETADMVSGLGRRVLARAVDVRDFEHVAAVVDETVATFGRLDIVVANAGISGGDSIQAASPAQWSDVIGVNLTGVFHAFRAAAPQMAGQNYGRLIAISSMMGRGPTPGMGAYTASKWGVIGLVKSTAQDLARFGVTVNAIAPGNIDTPMIRNDFLYRKVRPDLENPGFDDVVGYIGMLHAQPEPVLAPEEISAAVLFLAGPDARHMTGAVLDLNAGASARYTA